MVAAGLTPARALKAGTSIAAELLQRDDLGVLAPGKQADIVAMPGNPFIDIAATARVLPKQSTLCSCWAGHLYARSSFDVDDDIAA
jgi:imidazolonepropionase-like amidohydrolase